MRIPSFVFAAMLLAVCAVACAQPDLPKPHFDATLRIGMWTLWHDKQLSLASEEGSSAGSAAIFRLCQSCAATPLSKPIQLVATGGNVVLGDGRQTARIWLSGPVLVTAHRETVALHNPVRISARNGELVLVVTLPIESYVERVVASESGPADSAESLKALAVVVRSFALHLPHGHADYDLCDTTHCQLLHWAGARDEADIRAGEERAAAHAATLATAGETLWFHNGRAAAWFHQNCGGRTASPAEVWPAKGATSARSTSARSTPWLVSRADPYCTAKGAREWSTTLSLADLSSALAAAGLVPPGWQTLTVARRGESGRAIALLAGSTQISGEDFRIAVGRSMGWGKILSTWFEVSPRNSPQGVQFAFHGRGSGHGVGLCQAGAAAMSAQGHDYHQILAQYFPGAIAADEQTGLEWRRLQPGQSSASGFTLETLTSTDAAFLPDLAKALAEAQARSGFHSAGGITVRAFPSTGAFRQATLAPGWVAAFTEGNWIAAQPLRTLAARNLLASVMRHEFLHALVEAQAAPATPLWLREGLAETSANEPSPDRPSANRSQPAMKLEAIDTALAHASTQTRSKAAHDAAAWYAQRLLDHYGRTQVLTWLHHGLPPSAVSAIQ